jgi:uncharacterized protein (TIGR03083 family)
MTDTLPFSEALMLVDEHSAAFRDTIAAAPDLDARVPGCPDWSLRDLAAHLGEVHRFWSVVVRAGAAEDAPPRAAIGDTEPHGDLADWFGESTRMLLSALREAGPDAACWTWWRLSDAPQTAGAVARHQVHETAVHSFDAQETVGKPEPIPASIAVDGVAEFLLVTLGAEGPWSHRPARVVFATDEGPSWTVDLTPAGAKLDPAASGEPVATVHGPASDMLLALFGRVPLDRLRIDGDASLAHQLREWSDTT